MNTMQKKLRTFMQEQREWEIENKQRYKEQLLGEVISRNVDIDVVACDSIVGFDRIGDPMF